jgi:hypothetical protein
VWWTRFDKITYVDGMDADLRNVRRNRDVREKGTRPARSVSKNDKALDETLEAERYMCRGKQEHEDSSDHNRYAYSRMSALVPDDEKIGTEENDVHPWR